MHEHHVVAAGVVEAGRHGDLHAEVARQLHERRRSSSAARPALDDRQPSGRSSRRRRRRPRSRPRARPATSPGARAGRRATASSLKTGTTTEMSGRALGAQRTVHTIPSDTPAGSVRAALDELGLAAHGQLEPAVERARGEVQVRLAVAVGAQALQRPDDGHRGQHRAVEVAAHGRLPPLSQHPLAEHRAGVAAVVVPRRVVLAPEPGVGRHGDDQARAGGGDPAQLRQRRPVLGQVLDHVGGEQQVEAPVLERQLLDRALLDPVQAAPVAEIDRLWAELSTPSTGPRRRKSIMLRPVPQPASRMRGESTGCARSISAQITRRRERNHQWRSSMSKCSW